MAFDPSVVPATIKLPTSITEPPFEILAKKDVTAVALVKKAPTEIGET